MLVDIVEKLRLIHTQAMIDKVLATLPEQGFAHLDADTIVSSGSRQAALLAVSAVCDAIDAICQNKAKRAFCAVRPPGHHAEPQQAMGFCVFNNIAIGAAYALRHYKLQRIAILDFDVHHGNGTQAAFIDNPQVLYASSHEWPHYPGTGAASEKGMGNIINVPLPAGTTGSELREHYLQHILPALTNFNPQLLLISAGFDAHYADPLANLRLDKTDFIWLTEQLILVANDCCQGRIISVLEGGYNLNALAECVAAHVVCLMEVN
jgi:acetoin utilization deacetylase AcuC-like enzyme